MRPIVAYTVLSLCILSCSLCAAEDAATVGLDHFEKHVRPLLARHCYRCHSLQADRVEGELELDHAEGLRKGGSRGKVIVPGSAEESLLYRAVSGLNDDLEMPPSRPLKSGEIQILREWIDAGGQFPEYKESAEGNQQLWSVGPLVMPQFSPDRERWSRNRLDAFIKREHRKRSLKSQPEADRRRLIRRLYFDTIGLPPSMEEVQWFLEDASPLAYEQLVDRVMANPHFGERWARLWLDVARYTDTTASWLKSTGKAWRYRDWVVAAFNKDLPYDQFVLRQLAADQLPGLPPEEVAALGFLGLSPTYWKEPRLSPEVIRMVVAEEWDERVDTVTRSFLGLTVSCARCHDHKFDPITMQDYYGLAGVFASTQLIDLPLLAPAAAEVVLQAEREIRTLTEQKEKLPAEDKEKAAELTAEIQAVKDRTPGYDAPRVNAVHDSSIFVRPDGPDRTQLHYEPSPRDLPVFQRGNPESHGPIVPRRFLSILDSEQSAFTNGSGRLELASSIVHRQGTPLAARVIVNRIWGAHFGQGIVTTPSNFGSQGELPTHPELLDDLAAGLVAHDWSLKWLHREILLSATYRQSSQQQHTGLEVDPENRWLWRYPYRKLDVEMWRDALLAVSGNLDTRLGGEATELTEPTNRRRTLYGKIARRELNPMLQLFDFPPPTSHSPARNITTTPLQQLFVLNSPFLKKQSELLSARIPASSDVPAQVRFLYEIVFQRMPSAQELDLAIKFLGETAPATEAWQQYAHALLSLNEFAFTE